MSRIIKEKDYIEHVDMTPEEREKELAQLKSESDNLTDWEDE